MKYYQCMEKCRNGFLLKGDKHLSEVLSQEGDRWLVFKIFIVQGEGHLLG